MNELEPVGVKPKVYLEIEMWADPVVEEVRKARAEAFASFREDIHRFFEYLRQRELENGEPALTLEPNRPELAATHDAPQN